MFKEKRFYSIAFSYALGVFNDNAFKIAVIYIVTTYLGLSFTGTEEERELFELTKNSEISLYFFLPFVLFATVAGWACDRFRRSTILKISKAAEIVIMSAGAWALYVFGQTENPNNLQIILLGAVFFMALQSTFFSPARNGIIPLLFKEKESSEANGMIEMMQFMGIIFGTAVGALALKTPILLICFPIVAVIGWLFSLKIPQVDAEDQKLKFNVNVFGELWTCYKAIRKQRALKFCVLGEAYFYALGVIIITCIINMSKFSFGLKQGEFETAGMIMMVVLSLGMGVGCFLAGKLSRGRIELGLVPIGIAGMLFFMFDFSFSQSVTRASIDLALMGVFGGFFVLPLKVYIQQRSDKKLRGRILAIDNFLSFLFMLGASVFVYFGTQAGWFEDTRVVLRLCVLVSIIIMIISFYLLPEFVVRFLVVTLTRIFYRMDVQGERHIPDKGPVLLLPNHVTWLDGFLITAATSREVKFMISDMYYNHWLFKPFFKWLGFIPVPEAKGKNAVVECLSRARESLENGDVVCIFPEGQLTRSGVMSEFKTGFTRMLPERDDLTIVPCYLGLIWGSIFSFRFGKNIKPRLPSNIPYPMSVRFGKPLPHDIDPQGARQAVRDLEMAVEKKVFENETPLHYKFMKYATWNPIKSVMQDSAGKPVSNINLLIRSLTLRNWLEDRAPEGEKYIGIVLPSCVAGSVSSLAIMYADKIPVFLNFTASKDALKHAVKKCSMKRVITSKLFIKKLKVELPADVEIIYLEDLSRHMPISCKLRAAFTILMPSFIVAKKLFPNSYNNIHATATVLFSSGSTGTPKGVVLSHYNFTSNLSGVMRVCNVKKGERLLGSMPLFHCFGFLSGFWLPLTHHNKVIYHANPLEAQKIGDLIQKHKLNIMFGTPTFLNSYSRKCTREQMKSLRLVVSGAEKLRDSVAEAFFNMSGVYPVEAYGATELSPAVSVNIPRLIWDLGKKPGKKGSIGHPIPGVNVKVVDVDSREVLKYGEEGLLLVKGPNVMEGYLDEPEKTAEVLQDGWYNTGDLAKMDTDGYITLTGRLSRFSKVAGEMIPHGAVEEAIHEAIETDEIKVVVVGRPDASKGEKLVVFHLPLDLSPAEIIKKMKEKGIPNLWIPRSNNFYEIEEIPLLGSGKIDMAQINAMKSES